jgi:hypothetical protein
MVATIIATMVVLSPACAWDVKLCAVNAVFLMHRSLDNTTKSAYVLYTYTCFLDTTEKEPYKSKLSWMRSKPFLEHTNTPLETPMTVKTSTREAFSDSPG